MLKNKYEIVKLNERNINSIEIIWKESLPENLKSMIGNHLIKSYLKKFLSDKSGLGVGIFQSNKLLGFVLFGNNDKIIRNIIKEDFFLILKIFILSFVFFNFKKINNFINCLIFIFLSKNRETDIKRDNTELLIICIDKQNQNKGLGSILISESVKKYDTYFGSFKSIFVKTLKKDENNVFFYKKNKFKYVFEVFGRIYLKY